MVKVHLKCILTNQVRVSSSLCLSLLRSRNVYVQSSLLIVVMRRRQRLLALYKTTLSSKCRNNAIEGQPVFETFANPAKFLKHGYTHLTLTSSKGSRAASRGSLSNCSIAIRVSPATATLAADAARRRANTMIICSSSVMPRCGNLLRWGLETCWNMTLRRIKGNHCGRDILFCFPQDSQLHTRC